MAFATKANNEIITNIEQHIIDKPKDVSAYNDLFDFLRAVVKEDYKDKVKVVADPIDFLRNHLTALMKARVDVPTTVQAGELLKKTYLFTAKDNFIDYMQYIEWERPVKERFWLPRAKVLKPVADAMQALADDRLDELFLSQPPRTGKAVTNDTPILTDNGFKNHGDLKVGDRVVGMDGRFKKVIAVHPKCQLDVLIEFTNGEKIQCHERHEWMFYDRASQKTKLLETIEWEKRTLETGEPGHRGHRYMLQLPERDYVQGEHKDLCVDPYFLGAWLGDGANKASRISSPKCDYAIIEKIESRGIKVSWQTEHKTTHVMYYGFANRADLQKYGMCHSRKRLEKHIPEIYFSASVEQRLQLLAGLLDTDGTLIKKEHRYQFSTSEERMRDDFIKLVSTFGWRCSVTKHEPCVSSSGIKANKPNYVIGFCPDCFIPCALERKQLREFSKRRAVSVKSITRVEPKEGNCITVEGDGMYLCGNTQIPTHNTTLMLFYVTWLIGRDSERSNLYSAFSDIITNAFYNGILEIINDPYTYQWSDVFPTSKINGTNAKDETLNIGRRKRYPSITCRSLYGTLNGACDANGVIISDDLIGGIEEALNKDRLVSAWSKVDNNLIPRGKEGCKLLWIGTRWSVSDPAGLRMNLLQTDIKFKNRRYKIVNVPALSETGVSNFRYDYGVGFSTEYYNQRKASFIKNNDEASWLAQYQGEPVERSGTLFERSEMKYFSELPDDSTLVRKFAACDPAFGGGDFCSMPICYEYESGIYVVDVVYSNASKKFTQPTIASRIADHGVQAVQFECNLSTASFKEGVEQILKEKGYKCNITFKNAPNNVSKEVRIYDKAPEIREMYFLEGAKRNTEYEQFMDNVFSFTINGRNKHDDSVDSLAMCVEMSNYSGYQLKVRKRFF